jgi:PTS system nitrogen regulatory IIA component
LAPEDAAQQHLDILAEVAQLFSDEAFRLKLADQTDSGVVHRLLTTGSV